MPQMSPISWTQIFIILIISVIQMKSILYFSNIKMNKSFKKEKKQMNIKW